MNKNTVETNARLNAREFSERKIVLASYPRTIFVQIDAPCNQDCLFCSRPAAYSHFDLEDWRRKFEEKLTPAMERAERLILTGSGELLSLPEAKKNLAYFDRFPFAEKMFATNGSTLTPKMVDVIARSPARYTIHVSLHSTDQATHRIMAAADTYGVVMHNLAYLKEAKKKATNLTVNFVFLMTTKNIEQLPGFVRFAAEHGADGVVAYYNFVYRPDQRAISCFFAQEQTNRMMDAAEEEIKKNDLHIRLSLPLRFKQAAYARPEPCGEAWSQIMINSAGDVISCDAAGDSRENMLDKSFMDVWNGPYYTSLRERLVKADKPCSNFCLRADPAAVNDFRSHIITRGKSEEEIARFVEGTCG